MGPELEKRIGTGSTEEVALELTLRVGTILHVELITSPGREREPKADQWNAEDPSVF